MMRKWTKGRSYTKEGIGWRGNSLVGISQSPETWPKKKGDILKLRSIEMAIKLAGKSLSKRTQRHTNKGTLSLTTYWWKFTPQNKGEIDGQSCGDLGTKYLNSKAMNNYLFLSSKDL